METNTSKLRELNAEDSEQMLSLIASGNRSNVEDFLTEKGASVNTSFLTDYDLKSYPLHVSVDVELPDYHHGLIKYFISEGADCNVLDSGGYAPLHYAAIQHNITATEALLQAGADVNLRSNSDGISDMSMSFGAMDQMYYSCRYEKSFPLHLVLKVEYHNCKDRKGEKSTSVPDLVKILLSHEADCNLFDNFGPTPLHCAVQIDDIALVSLFLDAGANVNSTTQEKDSVAPIFNAENVSMLIFLLSKNANAEKILENGNNILHHSISNYRFDVIKFLVQEMPVLLHAKNGKNVSPIAGVVDHLFVFSLEQENQDVIEDIIRLMMKAGCDPVRETFKEEAREDYIELFNYTPSGAELLKYMEKATSKPRPLLDLCTIQIRNILQRSISSAVESLPLPTKLKQILTLQYN